MTTMNMADALSSPEFMDQGSYIRTTSVIGSNGMAADTVAYPVAFHAIFMPGGSHMLRFADGTRMTADLFVYTQVWLTNGLKLDDANSYRADLVLWHGRQYTVKDVKDFNAFSGLSMVGVSQGGGIQIGQTSSGFMVAACDLLPLNPASGA